MSPIEILVKGVLNEKKIIDSGISEAIANKIEPIINALIANESIRLSTAAQMLEGILANPNVQFDELEPENAANVAIAYSTALIEQLNKARDAEPDWIEETFEEGSRPDKRTVVRWINKGLIAGMILGKSVFVDPEETAIIVHKKKADNAEPLIAGRFKLKD